MIGANQNTKAGPYVRSQNGSEVSTAVYPVAASQTINIGDWLTISSGTLAQALALPGSNNTATASGAALQIWGVALESCITNAAGQFVDAAGNPDGTGRTGLQIAVATDDTEVLLRIWNSTASASEQQDVTLGTNYDLVRFRGASASQWFYSMGTTTANTVVKLVEKSPESAPDEDYGFVYVKVNSANRVNG